MSRCTYLWDTTAETSVGPPRLERLETVKPLFFHLYRRIVGSKGELVPVLN
jgi:hypothetical protein